MKDTFILHQDVSVEKVQEVVDAIQVNSAHPDTPGPQVQCSRNYWICEDGGMRTQNLSAFWMPELTLQRKIGHTVYSVTGAYDGIETVDGKLERIMEQNLINTEENE